MTYSELHILSMQPLPYSRQMNHLVSSEDFLHGWLIRNVRYARGQDQWIG